MKRMLTFSSWLGIVMDAAATALLPDVLWPLFLDLGWEQVRIEPDNAAFTCARDRVGRWAFVGLVGLLAVLDLAGAVGPPSPTCQAAGHIACDSCVLLVLSN
jgi:hypothetical protein